MIPPLEFTDVRIEEGEAFQDQAVGVVRLFGAWGETGGLLRLTRSGKYISLSRAQVFSEQPFPWPVSGLPYVIRCGRLAAVR